MKLEAAASSPVGSRAEALVITFFAQSKALLGNEHAFVDPTKLKISKEEAILSAVNVAALPVLAIVL